MNRAWGAIRDPHAAGQFLFPEKSDSKRAQPPPHRCPPMSTTRAISVAPVTHFTQGQGSLVAVTRLHSLADSNFVATYLKTVLPLSPHPCPGVTLAPPRRGAEVK